MPVLNTSQRNTLESTIIKARKLAENGARNALMTLAVDQTEPFTHLSPEQRVLRRLLRNRARLLGDTLEGKIQPIDHISYELAYEYWHKMLFAKFLESNGLLMHPEHSISVSMDDCEELAKDEGRADKWAAAAHYAARMLPAIFRIEDPLLKLEFSTEDHIALENLLTAIDDNIFTAEDSLGWVYQFWQSEAKERINKSGDRIDGEKLPAVTQLFTEPYMVQFLIDNTIGAWWVSRHPHIEPPVKFKYLRLLDDGYPAAGKFEGWPDNSAALNMLDPCMGSGHFIVDTFKVLAKLRMFEENLTIIDSAKKTIAENIFGLELDPRCTQIAAFNLALTVWKFIGSYQPLPEMNLACCGIAPRGKKDEWMKLAGKDIRMQNGMAALYDLFQQAPELGSLLDPSTIKADLQTASLEELQPALQTALEKEIELHNDEQAERGVMALGINNAAKILTKKFDLIITNVPYLSRSKQSDILAEYCLNNFPDAKGDLATVFYDKMLKSTLYGGCACCVIIQNWLFLTTYKSYRERLLKTESWSLVARLGAKAFQTQMWDFNVMLILIVNSQPEFGRSFYGLDVSQSLLSSLKDQNLLTIKVDRLIQSDQLKNPDARIVIGEQTDTPILQKYAKALQGIATGDFSRFGRLFWEIHYIDNQEWVFQQTTFSSTQEYVGKHNIIHWENGKGILASSPGARVQGLDSITKRGVAVTQMATLNATINLKTIFDNNTSVILPENNENLLPIWAFCSSKEFNEEVRKIDQKVSVTNATLVKVPFDLNYWQKVVKEKYPNGLPDPYSNDPTQWLFKGEILTSDNPLQVSVIRLLGYRWPEQPENPILDSLEDDDGIVCIPAVNGEPTASDRLRDVIKCAYGDDWDNHTIEKLLNSVGSGPMNLENWLRDVFFEQHIKLFQNRPFIWHIWDERKDGFGALVNYHKLTKENLQKIIFTYLGDWIRQCEAKVRNNESGGEGLLSAAKELKKKLELILEGESPYDIFVRWKSLHQLPIGWDPDINDGVRLNIRPFIIANILRKKPNIKWEKDRGKNPPGSPWGEERINDLHLNLEEKRTAKQEWEKSQRAKAQTEKLKGSFTSNRAHDPNLF